MTQKPIKQVKSSINLGITNIADEGLYKHKEVMSENGTYTWKQSANICKIRTFRKNFKIKAQMYKMKCIFRITKLTIPQTVTLLYF